MRKNLGISWTFSDWRKLIFRYRGSPAPSLNSLVGFSLTRHKKENCIEIGRHAKSPRSQRSRALEYRRESETRGGFLLVPPYSGWDRSRGLYRYTFVRGEGGSTRMKERCSNRWSLIRRRFCGSRIFSSENLNNVNVSTCPSPNSESWLCRWSGLGKRVSKISNLCRQFFIFDMSAVGSKFE